MAQYAKELKDLECGDERIINWKYISLKEDTIRIYYKTHEPIEEKLGFKYYIIEGIAKDYTNGVLDKDYSSWNCLFNGIAYFDGVRHLHLGDVQTENEGYLYYPHLSDLILILQELKKLEQKYCRESY